MTSLKPSSITSFFAAKPSTIAKKRKPRVIAIDAGDEGPAEAVIVVHNAGTKKDNRLVDVTFVVDGDFLLVSFHFPASPRGKAEAVRKFVPGWSAANKYLVYDKDAKGMYYKPSSVAPHSNDTHCCVLIVGREAPGKFLAG